MSVSQELQSIDSGCSSQLRGEQGPVRLPLPRGWELLKGCLEEKCQEGCGSVCWGREPSMENWEDQEGRHGRETSELKLLLQDAPSTHL